MEILGESNNKPEDNKLKDTSTGASLSSSLTPFSGALKETSITPPLQMQAINNSGSSRNYYIVSFRITKDGKGRNFYTVSDHTNIERFIQNMLLFGLSTYDINIIEKSDDYIEAVTIMNQLICEENAGVIKKMRLGGMLTASYTLKEMFTKGTKLRKYGI